MNCKKIRTWCILPLGNLSNHFVVLLCKFNQLPSKNINIKQSPTDVKWREAKGEEDNDHDKATHVFFNFCRTRDHVLLSQNVWKNLHPECSDNLKKTLIPGRIFRKPWPGSGTIFLKHWPRVQPQLLVVCEDSRRKRKDKVWVAEIPQEKKKEGRECLCQYVCVRHPRSGFIEIVIH